TEHKLGSRRKEEWAEWEIAAWQCPRLAGWVVQKVHPSINLLGFRHLSCYVDASPPLHLVTE
ncbi:hypothetical protein ACQP3F_31495, partial [Escherichia coli]